MHEDATLRPDLNPKDWKEGACCQCVVTIDRVEYPVHIDEQDGFGQVRVGVDLYTILCEYKSDFVDTEKDFLEGI